MIEDRVLDSHLSLPRRTMRGGNGAAWVAAAFPPEDDEFTSDVDPRGEGLEKAGLFPAMDPRARRPCHGVREASERERTVV